jgi:hypothetical protein
VVSQQIRQRAAAILGQVPAVGQLLRVWSALGKRLGVSRRAVTRNNFDAWMILKPLCTWP